MSNSNLPKAKRGPMAKIDRSLLTGQSKKWLVKRLEEINRLKADGIITPDSARSRRYIVRLLAQGKCVRCRQLNDLGTIFCRNCRKPRREIRRRWNMKAKERLRVRLRALEAKVKTYEAQIKTYQEELGRTPLLRKS